jgi:hypothetical protein
MRRGLGVLVVVLAVCVPAASSLSTVGWKGLKYFDYESHQLVVATDAAWKGGRVVPTASNQKLLDISGPGLKRTNPKWIWARTCGSSPQVVTFTRQIRAPGNATEGSVNLTLGFGRDLPFKEGELLVNGKEVARVVVKPGRLSGFPAYISGPVPPKALKALKYGLNTLTIRAERKAIPKGQGCYNPNRLVGIYATLSLTFRADLVAVPSTLGLSQIATKFGPYAGNMVFRNLGPSGTAGGKFFFEWSSQYADPLIGKASLSGVSNCKSTDDGKPFGKIECEFGELPAGKALTVGFRGAVREPDGWRPTYVGDLFQSWQIQPAGGDVKPANNHGSHRITICGPLTTDSRCKK